MYRLFTGLVRVISTPLSLLVSPLVPTTRSTPACITFSSNALTLEDLGLRWNKTRADAPEEGAEEVVLCFTT